MYCRFISDQNTIFATVSSIGALRKSIRDFWHFISKHAYAVTILIFVVVVGFLDPNSYYHRYLQHEEVVHLQDEISNYQSMYDRDTKTLKELEANPRAIEKVARERYFMKKPNEDIYVFKEQ